MPVDAKEDGIAQERIDGHRADRSARTMRAFRHQVACAFSPQTSNPLDIPCRTLALRRRHMRQLRKSDRDQHGVPVDSTARPYGLWASPRDIAVASRGLGVYFTTVRSMLWLALLLTTLAIYPMVDNAASNGWSRSYVLVAGNGTVEATPALPAAALPAAVTCAKTWQLSSPITRITAGTHCALPAFASAFDCMASCEAPSGTSFGSLAMTMVPLNDTSGDDAGSTEPEACVAYPPCDGSSSTMIGLGCCTLQLDEAAVDPDAFPRAQIALLVLGQAVFLAWLLLLSAQQRGAVATSDDAQPPPVTSAHYSVLVSGLPRDVCDFMTRAPEGIPQLQLRKDLGGHKSKTGGWIPGQGADTARNEITSARILAARPGEAEASGLAGRQGTRDKDAASGGVEKDALGKIQANLETQSVPPAGPATSIKPQAPSDVLPPPCVSSRVLLDWATQFGPVVMGAPIVTFSPALRVGKRLTKARARKQESCELCKLALRSPVRAALLRMLTLRRTHAMTERAVEQLETKLRFHEVAEAEPTGQALVTFSHAEHSRSCIATHPPSWLPGPRAARCRVGGHPVVVREAPEPSDILWSNLDITGGRAAVRRAGFLGVTILLAVGGAAAQYGLLTLAEHERSRRIAYLHRDQDDGAVSWSRNLLDSARLSGVSAAAGVAVVAINLTITAVTRAGATRERWHTYTAREGWLVVRLSTTYCANAFAVPILAAYLSGNRSSW